MKIFNSQSSILPNFYFLEQGCFDSELIYFPENETFSDSKVFSLRPVLIERCLAKVLGLGKALDKLARDESSVNANFARTKSEAVHFPKVRIPCPKVVATP